MAFRVNPEHAAAIEAQRRELLEGLSNVMPTKKDVMSKKTAVALGSMIAAVIAFAGYSVLP